VDFAEVVRGLRPFLQTLQADGIAVSTQLPGEPVRVHVERAQLEQVVTNLAVNARDAMLGGGRLLLELSRVPTGNADGELARLRVVDTGVGMDAHTQERIFEPYFTTKGEGRGVGLGLATVYRIVKGTEGSIHVKSALGEGTEFRVEWPLVR
jgi:signal transduction histidine kinase